MAAYTFPSAVVLVEGTGQLAVGATGLLRTNAGSASVQMYDLNGSPLPSVVVSSQGVHQPFTADIGHGVLDFGSVILPAISLEAMTAALEVLQSSEAAAAAASASAASAEAAAVSSGVAADAAVLAGQGGRLVFAGSDALTPRPAVEGPVLWLCTVKPVEASREQGDVWVAVTVPDTVEEGAGTIDFAVLDNAVIV